MPAVYSIHVGSYSSLKTLAVAMLMALTDIGWVPLTKCCIMQVINRPACHCRCIHLELAEWISKYSKAKYWQMYANLLCVVT